MLLDDPLRGDGAVGSSGRRGGHGRRRDQEECDDERGGCPLLPHVSRYRSRKANKQVYGESATSGWAKPEKAVYQPIRGPAATALDPRRPVLPDLHHTHLPWGLHRVPAEAAPSVRPTRGLSTARSVRSAQTRRSTLNLRPPGSPKGSLHARAARRPPERGDRRPRRPRQDHARRRPAAPDGGIRRPRGAGRPGHGLDRPRAGEGHHDPRQEHRDPVRRGEDQHRRHARPRRLRRRGRARPHDGRRRAAARRRGRGPAAADALRPAQDPRGPAARRARGQQGRPQRRPRRRGRARGREPVPRPRRRRAPDRLPDRVLQRPDRSRVDGRR